jgi:aminodeoxyfutalosine synthase
VQPDLDPTRFRDPVLAPIARKVVEGIRLDATDGVALYRTSDILGLGVVADWANRRVNGDRVFFSANQHLNPTNVCVLRKTCVFCSFARMPKEDGAYTRTLEEVFEEAEQARHAPTREFHIVGGLHPRLPVSYYADMFRGLKERHPEVHIKGLTAVEIAHLARVEKTTIEDVLVRLKDAGLDTMPGGGAEVFSTAVRATIAERKLTGEEWIRVHRTAHQLGIRTNCTMLYGHVETAEDRIEHLTMLRELQDDTGGFLTYIPLAYHPDHNELGEEMGRVGSATTGYEDLRNVAVARLYFDNIDHIKTHWPMVTPFMSQVLLDFGCDDVEGTVVYERVYHEAGAQTQMHMPYSALVRMIRGAGKRPVERDSFYRPVREDFDDLEGPALAVGAGAPSVHAA